MIAAITQEGIDNLFGNPVLAEQLLSEVADARSGVALARNRVDPLLESAAQVHHSLLPRPLQSKHLDIDFRYRPLEAVGGDYCQVCFPDPSSCYLTMCDVAGHGIGPSLLAARVSTEVRRLVMDRLTPSTIVQSLSAFVWDYFGDAQPLLSFLAARIDLDAKSITYSGAGHPPALHLSSETRAVSQLRSQNALIGVERHCLGHEPEHTRPFSKGDRLIFYTDGVTEATNSENSMLGHEGLARIALRCLPSRLFDMADEMLEHVALFRVGQPTDDMALVVMEMK